MNARRPLLALLAVSSLLLLLLAGCGGPKASQKGGQEDGKNARTYTVRGQVEKLPDTAAGDRELTVRHEAIDNFTSRDGRVMGMDSMAMGFALAPETSIDGVAPGDVIELKLRVDWEAENPAEISQITEVRKLPPGTKLDFREAKPPGQ
jgi:Cu/Ag efflux protein CusF